MKKKELINEEMRAVKGGFSPEGVMEGAGDRGITNSIVGCHAGEPGVFVTKCNCGKKGEKGKKGDR